MWSIWINRADQVSLRAFSKEEGRVLGVLSGFQGFSSQISCYYWVPLALKLVPTASEGGDTFL